MLAICTTFLRKVMSGNFKNCKTWRFLLVVFQVHNYVGEWLQYQSLWDLQADNLYGKLGEDINLWMKCLKDIK
jgi:hypothetical protein